MSIITHTGKRKQGSSCQPPPEYRNNSAIKNSKSIIPSSISSSSQSRSHTIQQNTDLQLQAHKPRPHSNIIIASPTWGTPAVFFTIISSAAVHLSRQNVHYNWPKPWRTRSISRHWRDTHNQTTKTDHRLAFYHRLWTKPLVHIGRKLQTRLISGESEKGQLAMAEVASTRAERRSKLYRIVELPGKLQPTKLAALAANRTKNC